MFPILPPADGAHPNGLFVGVMGALADIDFATAGAAAVIAQAAERVRPAIVVLML